MAALTMSLQDGEYVPIEARRLRVVSPVLCPYKWSYTGGEQNQHRKSLGSMHFADFTMRSQTRSAALSSQLLRVLNGLRPLFA